MGSCKAQTPCCGERHIVYLADYRGKPAAAGALLQRPHHVAAVPGRSEDELLRIKPEGAQSFTVNRTELMGCYGRMTPQDRCGGGKPPGERKAEAGRGRHIAIGCGDLMNTIAAKPTTRQGLIDFGKTELP